MREIGRRGRLLVATIMLSSVAMLGFSLADDLVLATTLLIVLSVIATIYWTLSEAMVMEITPDHLRGRVVSLAGVSMGLFPLGGVVFGGIAQVRGPQSATYTAALLMAACAGLLLVRFPKLWSFR